MSTLDTDLEPLREAFASLAEDAAPGPDCPDPVRLWDATRGDLPPADAQAVILHTVECPSCAEAWRLARELRADVDPRRDVARTQWLGGALPLAAALVAVLLAGGVVLREDRGTVASRYRDQDRPGLHAQTDEGRPLPRASFVLRWSSFGEGARYDLRVATSELAVVYRARGLVATNHHVPADALAGLPSGTRLLWQIEASAPDGTRTTSPTFVVRMR
jgi:hypothetical protein